nr:ubiquitin hydrolase [Tanacetum cinerariifolium]
MAYDSSRSSSLNTEFVEPSVKSYGNKPIEVVTQTSSVKISEPVKENNGAQLIKDWESNEEDEVESPHEIERKTVASNVDKVEVDIHKQNVKPARRPVKYAEMYRTQRPRGNQRNWNNLKFHQLGSNFVMYNKACYACESFNHLQARYKYHQRERMVESLETNLMQTKQIHGDAYNKLIKKVKKLEQTVKSSKAGEMTKELLQKINMQAERPRR